MDAAAAVANVRAIQGAFSVIGTLMLTAHLFPKQTPIKDFYEYDIIVVGGGSTGSVIADRLSECPDLDVLVIEAGDDPPIQSLLPSVFPYLTNSQYDWSFTSVVEENAGNTRKIKEFNISCGRVLGGGSSINYMAYVRGCPGDYDRWAERAKDSTWSYDNILPYFIKSERLKSEDILRSKYRHYHGTKGFLGVTRENRQIAKEYLQAFGELGYDILTDVNGKESLGYTLPLYTIADGIRQTTAYTNLGANKFRKNLKVLKRTLVTEILFDKNNNAIGVKAITDENKIITIKARLEVIVSAGTINTPKLLMLSGIGPKDHLQSLNIKVRSDLPVGKNLRDHNLFMLYIKINDMKQRPVLPNDPHQIPSPIVTGYVAINKLKTCADYQTFNFIMEKNSIGPVQFCSFNYNYKDYICQKMYEAGRDKYGIFTVLSFLHPKSHGQITLSTANPLDPPKIFSGMFTNKRDIDDFTDYVEDFVRVVNTSYFRSVKAEILDLAVHECIDLEFGSRDYWRCYVKSMTSTFTHYIGTAALGSVVDNKLRVFNVNRLRVADASIMPTHVSGNPNAVVIMIGEKLADFVKNEYGRHCCN